MKLKHYLILITLLTALLFITPEILMGKANGNNKNKTKLKTESNAKVIKSNNSNSPNHSYSYRGKYKNFNNNNHNNRYFYNGKYYNFKDYYSFYRRGNNVFTYQGRYGKHKNIYIFSDSDGNEFDMYLKPVGKAPLFFKGNTLVAGTAYKMNIKPTRMYPTKVEINNGIRFPFGWGNMTLQNGRYFEMYSASNLVNVNGQVYIKG